MEGDKSGHPFLTQSGADREGSPDQYIANMRDGAVAGYKYFDFRKNRPSEVEVSVRGAAKGDLVVYTDISCKEPVARIPVDVRDKDTYLKSSGKIEIQEGILPLYFRYEGEGAVDFYSFELKN